MKGYLKRVYKAVIALICIFSLSQIQYVDANSRLIEQASIDATNNQMIQTDQPIDFNAQRLVVENEVSPFYQVLDELLIVFIPDQKAMKAYDLTTNVIVWEKVVGEEVLTDFLSDGEMIYVFVRTLEDQAKLIAVDRETGDLAWELKANSGLSKSPVIARGDIYYVDINGYLIKINKETGEEENRTALNIGEKTSNLTYAAGVLFVSSGDRHAVMAVDIGSGQVKWRSNFSEDTTGFLNNKLVVSPDGQVYLNIYRETTKTAWPHQVYQKSGFKIANRQMIDILTQIATNRKPLFQIDQYLVALDMNTGKLRWETKIDTGSSYNAVRYSEASYADGRIYVPNSISKQLIIVDAGDGRVLQKQVLDSEISNIVASDTSFTYSHADGKVTQVRFDDETVQKDVLSFANKAEATRLIGVNNSLIDVNGQSELLVLTSDTIESQGLQHERHFTMGQGIDWQRLAEAYFMTYGVSILIFISSCLFIFGILSLLFRKPKKRNRF